MDEWINLPEDDKIKNSFGFIYVIERINSIKNEPKFYWGCKQFWTKRTLPPLKGKTKKRKLTKESDWRTYWGSSEKLLKDIEKYGKSNFKKTILKICDCKWELKYEEMLLQLENNVLFRDDVYNGIIHVRLNSAPKSIKKKYENRNL